MSTTAILVVTFITWFSAVQPSTAAIDLEKQCFQPDQVAQLLKILRNTEWRQLDRQRLQAMWPKEFRISDDCQVGEGEEAHPCTLMSAGFCSDSVCYCNVAFDLHTLHGKEEQLKSVTIFYSHSDLEQVVMAAKLFVNALQPLTEKFSVPNNGWALDQNKRLSKMYGYYPDYSVEEGGTITSGGDFGVQFTLYTLENGISSVYLTLSDPDEVRPPNNSLQRTSPRALAPLGHCGWPLSSAVSPRRQAYVLL